MRVRLGYGDIFCGFPVKTRTFPGGRVRPDDLAALAAITAPREADRAEHVAPKLSARLLHTHGADAHPMTRHAA